MAEAVSVPSLVRLVFADGGFVGSPNDFAIPLGATGKLKFGSWKDAGLGLSSLVDVEGAGWAGCSAVVASVVRLVLADCGAEGGLP